MDSPHSFRVARLRHGPEPCLRLWGRPCVRPCVRRILTGCVAYSRRRLLTAAEMARLWGPVAERRGRRGERQSYADQAGGAASKQPTWLRCREGRARAAGLQPASHIDPSLG